MKTIFGRRFPISIRLVIITVISVILIYSTELLSPVRPYLSTFFSPVKLLSQAPLDMIAGISEHVKSRHRLMSENKELRLLQLSLSDRLLRVTHLEQENQRLRALLSSRAAMSQKKLIAQVQTVDADPFRLQIVVNKGLRDDVYLGQPVVDEHGVVGQVIEVSLFSSRILLIADNSHSIPLRNQRNDVRLIGVGRSDLHQMELQYVTKNSDVKIGDLLVTSGLGGRFPEGYPVAKVVDIDKGTNEIYARISIKPIAKLDRIRYVLLLWPDKTGSEAATTAPLSS